MLATSIFLLFPIRECEMKKNHLCWLFVLTLVSMIFFPTLVHSVIKSTTLYKQCRSEVNKNESENILQAIINPCNHFLHL